MHNKNKVLINYFDLYNSNHINPLKKFTFKYCITPFLSMMSINNKYLKKD